MATDIEAVVSNLTSFYDFSGKAVLHVGAGGGQLIGYAARAASVLAVDPDPPAVERLKTALRRIRLEDRFRVVQAGFEEIVDRADVVFFEFCLHEMRDAGAALRHARSLAPEILVMDHLPKSPWAWYAAEEEKTERSWTEVHASGVAREASFSAIQHFDDYSQLDSKFQELGEPAVSRIAELSGRRNLEIRMDYAVALLETQAVPAG